MNLRKATIWYYLKTVAPVFEITEATKPHRWPEIRRVQNDMYKGFMNAVTEYEIKLLKTLGLPDINTVRKEALTKWLKGKKRYFLLFVKYISRYTKNPKPMGRGFTQERFSLSGRDVQGLRCWVE